MKLRIRFPRPRQIAHFLERQAMVVPRTSRVRVITATVLFALALAAGAQLAVHRVNQLPSDAALRIGDRVITKDQFQQRVHLLDSLYGVRAPKDPTKRDQFNRDTAKAIAVSEILEAAAGDNGIVVPDKSAHDQLAKLIKDSHQGDRRAFVQFLGTKGISQRDVVDELKRQLTSAKLFARITKTVKPATDSEARNYYAKHRDQMVSPEQRGIRNIVVASESEAEQIAQQARAGATIAKLALQHSMDGKTKEKGGYLGVVSADQLDPKFAKVAFASKSNAVFGPVKTANGWNVGQVTKIHPAVPMSFEQLRNPLKQKLTNEAKMKAWSTWLTSEIKAAEVEYAEAYVPVNPDAPPGTASE